MFTRCTPGPFPEPDESCPRPYSLKIHLNTVLSKPKALYNTSQHSNFYGHPAQPARWRITSCVLPASVYSVFPLLFSVSLGLHYR